MVGVGLLVVEEVSQLGGARSRGMSWCAPRKSRLEEMVGEREV